MLCKRYLQQRADKITLLPYGEYASGHYDKPTRSKAQGLEGIHWTTTLDLEEDINTVNGLLRYYRRGGVLRWYIPRHILCVFECYKDRSSTDSHNRKRDMAAVPTLSRFFLIVFGACTLSLLVLLSLHLSTPATFFFFV